MTRVKRCGEWPTVFGRMIGCSAAMRHVFEQIERAAQADTTVLLRGESGTGKELAARAIHENSPRRHGPFIAINVAAVPDTLIESELFGHVQGAFTGADKDRVGRFEAAHLGTLFIDEIGDVQLPSQAKLLRVLEDRRVTPVGSNEAREVDARVIFATNRNLEEMVTQGKFREDLYYRINVVSLALPPLREHREDIAPLTRHFLDELCVANRKPPAAPDTELMRFLKDYDWPGNVRQLRSCLESMLLFADSARLTVKDLPAIALAPNESTDACCTVCQKGTLEEIIRGIVLRRLRRCGGSRLRTADSLGISVRTLQRRLIQWGNGDGQPVQPTGDTQAT